MNDPTIPAFARAAACLLAAAALAGCATAATGEGEGDAYLAPRAYAQDVETVVGALVRVLATTEGWELVDAAAAAGRVRANHYTKTLGFRDQVEVRVEAADAGGTIVHARSTSTIGFGDMGQNRRNLVELFAGLDAALAGEGPEHGAKSE